MRIEQEEGESLRTEVRPACNRGKGGDVRAGLRLAAGHDVAACTPAFGEVGAVTGIGGERRRCAEARGQGKQQANSSQMPVHRATFMRSLAVMMFIRSTIPETGKDRS